MIEKIVIDNPVLLDIYVQEMGPIIRKIVHSIKEARKDRRDKDAYLLLKELKRHQELCRAYDIDIRTFFEDPEENPWD